MNASPRTNGERSALRHSTHPSHGWLFCQLLSLHSSRTIASLDSIISLLRLLVIDLPIQSSSIAAANRLVNAAPNHRLYRVCSARRPASRTPSKRNFGAVRILPSYQKGKASGRIGMSNSTIYSILYFQLTC